MKVHLKRMGAGLALAAVIGTVLYLTYLFPPLLFVWVAIPVLFLLYALGAFFIDD